MGLVEGMKNAVFLGFYQVCDQVNFVIFLGYSFYSFKIGVMTWSGFCVI